jgi:phospholipase C
VILAVLFTTCRTIAQEAALTNVQHVVIFMQENRSFDHYFGSLHGVRGFNDLNALVFQNGKSDFYQPLNSGYVLPFNVSSECLVDLDHSWGPTHAAWNGGKWDQWIPNKSTTTMAYYTRTELPFYYALADAYTVCDAFFCSVLGPTNPNRLYLWTGMVDPNGTGGGPAIDNSEPGFTWTTYPERLQTAGVSWKVYQQPDNFDDNALAWFTQFRNAPAGSPLHDRGMATVPDLLAAFAADVTNHTLPQVSWLIAPTSLSEHPSASPGSGEVLTRNLLDALSADPVVFRSTVFILTYDENDGFFDHIPPPVPPSGTPAEFVAGLPIGLGVRVPTIVISPWTRGGHVCSQVFDFTSILRFLENWTGVPEPNISAWRRKVCGDLTLAFDFANPDFSYPALPTPIAVNCPTAITPTVPSPQTFPAQEPGALLSRPLPYQLDAAFDAACGSNTIQIIMTNAGSASGHLAIYPNAYRTDGPWQYDVPPAASITDSFSTLVTTNRYDFTAYGPDGFQRRFAGTLSNQCNQVEVTAISAPGAGGINFVLRNDTGAAVTFTLTANAFVSGGPWIFNLSPANTVSNAFLTLTNSGGWYDFTATESSDTNFLRRFAGHLEGVNSRPGLPVIATQPITQNADAGTTVVLTVAALNGPFTYQWQLNGTNIPAATNSTYSIANLGLPDAGIYRVLVSNAQGTALSNPAQLTVNTSPQIFGQFVGEVLDAGTEYAFAPQTIGGRPLIHYWYRDGDLISASSDSALSLTNLSPAQSGGYRVVASNSFGMTTSMVSVLKVYRGPLTNQLVVHLPFDGNFNDTSGRGNNARYATNGSAANPNPLFVPGKLGQAFQYTTLSDGSRFEYATLGYPADLRFGAASDFTVSLWVNYTNQSDDLPFISNKDWNASANQGWGVFTQTGGNFRLNVTGPNSNADKFSIIPATLLRDGVWHHLLVSFVRAVPPQSAYVYSYVDGVLVDKSPMSVGGSIDTFALPFRYTSPKPTRQTNWALNLGQDGTGVYYDLGNAYNLGAKIDDVGIWRRALTPDEAYTVYAAGTAGNDLSKVIGPGTLAATFTNGLVRLDWTGSLNLKVQMSTDISSTTWVDLPSSLGTNSAMVQITNRNAFFRLAH